MSLIMGKRYDIPAFSQHLNAFCDDDRGPVLQRTGTARKFRLRFVNPLLQPFVLLKGVSDGMVTMPQLSDYFTTMAGAAVRWNGLLYSLTPHKHTKARPK